MLAKFARDIECLWHPFSHRKKIDPQKFCAVPVLNAPPPERPAFYATSLSYPAVSVISLFFPRVQTMQEALLFYYLCRALGLVALLLLLYLANRIWELPYVALVFFSFPLVIQQVIIISPDVLINLGTIAAIMIFLRLWQKQSDPNKQSVGQWPQLLLYLLLWGLCLLMTRTKPIVAGILLLPLWLFPFYKLPLKRVVIPSLIVLALGGVVLAMPMLMRVLIQAAGIAGAEDRAAQIEYLQTAEGLRILYRSWRDCVSQFWDARVWTSHLGWLDTPLSPHHLFLIALSCMFALLLDLWKYVPRAPQILRQHKAQMVWMSVIILANAFFLSFTICTLMYIGSTPPRYPVILGLQMRYFFPIAILALLLPLLLFGNRSDATEDSTSKDMLNLVVNTSALALLFFLSFARTVELLVDLTTRYW